MKIAATTAIVGTILSTGVLTNLPTPNPNYADTPAALVTYAANNEVDVMKNEPKVVLKKWNGEVQLGVKVGNGNTISAPVGITATIKNTIASGEDVVMEPTADGQGFNVDITLASEPVTNVFTYQLTGWENLDFFYQAPLWQEAGLKAPTANCTDTDCTTSDGTSHRPSNVVGSYAVYYKNHANHLVGSTNYETGKAYHIYRPQVTDAKGNQVWADLSYANGILTITVPQSFLDSAVYPVVVDPTFGSGSACNGTQSNMKGSNLATTIFVSPASSGTVTKISTCTHTSFPAGIMKAVLWDSSGVIVTNGIGGTVSVNSGTNQFWDMTYSTSPSVTSGINYFVGSVQDTNNSDFIYYDTGSAATGGDQANNEASPTNLSLALSNNTHKYLTFATYTTGAAAPTNAIFFGGD